MKTLILLALALTCSALENPGAMMDRLKAKHEAEDVAAIASWLRSAGLREVAVPKVGADPRASEFEAAAAARDHNALVERLKIDLDRLSKGGKEAEDAKQSLLLVFRQWDANHPQVKDLMRHLGVR